MSNKLNPFEEHLKKVAESHEVPYDSNQWSSLEKQLDKKSPAGGSYRKWSIAAAAVLMSVAAYYFMPANQVDTENLAETKVETSMDATQENSIKDPQISNKSSNSEIENEGTNPNVKFEKKPVENAISRTQEPNITKSEIKIDKPIEKGSSSSSTVTNSDKKTKEEIIENSNFKAPEIVLSVNRICAGIELSAELSTTTNSNVVWELGNGVKVEETTLNYTFLESGVYEIQAYFPEFNVYSEKVEVVVNPKPDASFTIKEELENGMIPVMKFVPNTVGEKHYSWSYGDGTVMNSETGSHTYHKKNEYPVSLQVVNKYGCTWVSYDRITIEKDFNLLAPNAFSPNGDGENDSWIPIGLTKNYFDFDLRVFDRIGNLVFETSNPEVKFEGKVNGTLSPSGETFIWKAFTIDPNGLRQEYSGVVMLYY